MAASQVASDIGAHSALTAPIIDRNGGQHTSNEAEASALADPLPVSLNDITGYVYLPELHISQEVTSSDVVAALKHLPPDKAPGPDGIPNRFLRECRGILARPLAVLFQECLNRVYHPTSSSSSGLELMPPGNRGSELDYSDRRTGTRNGDGATRYLP